MKREMGGVRAWAEGRSTRLVRPSLNRSTIVASSVGGTKTPPVRPACLLQPGASGDPTSRPHRLCACSARNAEASQVRERPRQRDEVKAHIAPMCEMVRVGRALDARVEAAEDHCFVIQPSRLQRRGDDSPSRLGAKWSVSPLRLPYTDGSAYGRLGLVRFFFADLGAVVGHDPNGAVYSSASADLFGSSLSLSTRDLRGVAVVRRGRGIGTAVAETSSSSRGRFGVLGGDVVRVRGPGGTSTLTVVAGLVDTTLRLARVSEVLRSGTGSVLDDASVASRLTRGVAGGVGGMRTVKCLFLVPRSSGFGVRLNCWMWAASICEDVLAVAAIVAEQGCRRRPQRARAECEPRSSTSPGSALPGPSMETACDLQCTCARCTITADPARAGT